MSPAGRTTPLRTLIGRLLGGGSAEQAGYADPVLAAAGRMLELVDRLCAEGPLVLVFEDVHWADEASVALAERISRQVDQLPLLLVITARPAPAAPGSTRSALRDSAEHLLPLSPLDSTEVIALARARLSGPPGPRLSALLGAASGSPLYVCEILRSLDPEGLIALPDGSVELRGADRVPTSLANAIGHRLDVLRPEHLQVLSLAAFLGNEFAVENLRLLADPDEAEVPAVLGAAAAAGIVEVAGDRVRFIHELVRQVLLEKTPAAVRGSLHDHIARTLAGAHCPDLMIAGHLTAASDPLQTWAIQWLAQRPESALNAAATAYAELLRRALQTLTPADPCWLPLTHRLVLVSFRLGRDETVIKLGGQAVAHTADTDLAGRLRMQVMRSYSRTSAPARSGGPA